MTNDAENTGFMSRWSQRKSLARQGTAPVNLSPALAEPTLAAATPAPQTATAVLLPPPVAEGRQVEAEPAPTLADVANLTHDADYSRFMRGSVQPDVKNAALAKLFTDPHFNVMDGLDVYIDDYGKPDPLPPGMLRQMFQSQVLGLFDDEEEEEEAALTEPASSPLLPATDTDTDTACNENTALQLQPDDGAGRRVAALGVDQNPGCPH